MASPGDVVGSVTLVGLFGRTTKGNAIWDCRCSYGHAMRVRIDKLKYAVKCGREPCSHCSDALLIRECRHCGARHESAVAAICCCLFAPAPQGWCAWCGKDCELTFCRPACGLEHTLDHLSGRRRAA